jgi:hypothetical protein
MTWITFCAHETEMLKLISKKNTDNQAITEAYAHIPWRIYYIKEIYKIVFEGKSI